MDCFQPSPASTCSLQPVLANGPTWSGQLTHAPLEPQTSHGKGTGDAGPSQSHPATWGPQEPVPAPAVGQQELPQDPGAADDILHPVSHVPTPWTHLKLARVLIQKFLAIGQILPGLGSEGGGYPLPAAQLHLRQSGRQGDSFRDWRSLQVFPSSPQAPWDTPPKSISLTPLDLAWSIFKATPSPRANYHLSPTVVQKADTIMFLGFPRAQGPTLPSPLVHCPAHHLAFSNLLKTP